MDLRGGLGGSGGIISHLGLGEGHRSKIYHEKKFSVLVAQQLFVEL